LNREDVKTKRPWIWGLAGLVAALALAGGIWVFSTYLDEPAARDVILITVDTLRADRLGAYGHDAAKTPTIDALAARGRLFTRATTPLPRTTPGLATVLTGLRPENHGSREVGEPMAEGKISIAEILDQRGYATLAVSANGAAGPRQNLDPGFDVFVDAKELERPWAELVTRRALELVEAVTPEERLLLWVHYVDPHFPYSPPGHWPEQPEAPACREAIRYGNEGRTQTAHLVADLDGRASRALEDCEALYDAEITYTDHGIAQLFEGLEAAGRNLSEAIVIFTADHGENLGEKELFFQHGPNVHHASLRVPLIIAGPGIEGGRDDRPARLEDLQPTLLALLGSSREERPASDGVPLLTRRGAPTGHKGGIVRAESGSALLIESFRYPVSGRARGRNCTNGPRYSLCGKPGEELALYDHVEDPDLTRDLSVELPEEKEALLAIRRRWPPEQARQRAVSDGRFKLVDVPRLEGGYERGLYDLEADPAEEHDVSSEHPETAERLARILDTWTEELPQVEGIDLSEEELDALRALGYIN